MAESTVQDHQNGALMNALRWRGQRDVALERIAVPVPADDEALVEVLWAGICGSDLEEYLHGPVVIAGPVVLGHEIVGRVVRAAQDKSGPAVGAIVVVDVVTGCGQCFWCHAHDEGLCPRLRVKGQHEDGGLAEYIAATAHRLVTIPPTLDPRAAALAEPTAVAVRAVRKLGDMSERGALIVGGGAIGLLVAQVLRVHGASPIVIVEPDPHRSAIARDLGFAVIWSDDPQARAEATAAHFPERGVDVVIECSGARGAAGEAIENARPSGTVVLLSVTPDAEQIDTTHVVLTEKTIIGSAAHMWDVDVAPAVELLASGAVQAEPLITRVFPLSDGPAAFEMLADRSQPNVKILVRVSDGPVTHDSPRGRRRTVAHSTPG